MNTVLRIETYDINIYNEFAHHFLKQYGFDGLKEENKQRIQEDEARTKVTKTMSDGGATARLLCLKPNSKRFRELYELDKLTQLGLRQYNHLNDDVLGIKRSFGLFSLTGKLNYLMTL